MPPIAPALASISSVAPAILGWLDRMDVPKKDYIYDDYLTRTLKPIILSLMSKQKLIMKLINKNVKSLAMNHSTDLLSTLGLVISIML